MAQSVKGMRDLFGAELRWFQHIEDTARRVFGRHGYGEIRTPILEELDVFKRSVGESSDIVNKEMYEFTDKGGRQVVMRPENTAGFIDCTNSKFNSIVRRNTINRDISCQRSKSTNFNGVPRCSCTASCGLCGTFLRTACRRSRKHHRCKCSCY